MMDFQTFARCNGVEITQLFASDKIIRCGTIAHPNSLNGSYLFDGKRGWCMSWEDQQEPVYFGGDIKEFTDADKKAWAVKKQAEEKLLIQKRLKAIQAAIGIIDSATLKEHGYLSYKGLSDVCGLVTPDDKLIIPMSSLTGELKGIQSIKWNSPERTYEKKMIFGMQAKNSIYRIGSNTATETILCEGYSTGLTIKKAIDRMRLNASVIVCFSANNMVSVAENFKNKTYVFADKDSSLTGEKCAVKTGLPFCISDEIGDANDLFVSKGLTAVVKKIMEVRASR